ncbi:GGDEF domain-containing protein [Tropicimonas sp. TH_r6]|uniref:GGDEF domain-containing protein n=1 Tax=Tropicimonas sp. TH_r6 TaxID=3082085 RepID=UPI002952D0CB|nr:GGDEF domain-containing protein [Tropicimonas sp. TH_r6]MDV7142466.1 GGDEF domain-containing protein [Tropicimonas sp. TH_r6]
MRLYDQLNRFLPESYVAKFVAILAVALAMPVLAALLVPTGTNAGVATLISAAVVAGIVAQRAIAELLAPLAKVSDSLQRTEAGYRARALPECYRDELGLLMECANRMAVHLDKQLHIAAQEAERDPLTGLLNRRGLERRMPTTRPGAILVIDLDRFKDINDEFGHAAGDRILMNVSDLLATTFRSGDVLARIGGEEFLACLPGATLEDGRQAAERVRIALEDRVAIEGRGVTASIGVACGHRGVAGWQVLEAADRAVFQAKSTGRNRVVCAKALYSDSERGSAAGGLLLHRPGG